VKEFASFKKHCDFVVDCNLEVRTSILKETFHEMSPLLKLVPPMPVSANTSRIAPFPLSLSVRLSSLCVEYSDLPVLAHLT
jgi:hypothetical protein